MKELFINELRRFRNAALIAAAVHLVLLALVNQLSNLLQLPFEMYMAMLALYMIAGAGLGLYQFGTYRQPSRWIWLLHRPVPHSHVFAGLAAAVGVLIVGAIGLPALLVVACNDLFTTNIVDLRHYLLVPHIVLFVAMAWMCGAYMMLSRSRSAFVLLVIPVWMLLHGGSGLAMLAPALLCLALLGFVVFTAVKPDRTAPPKSAGALLTVSLPQHLGFYFAILWAGSLGFQYGEMLLGVHPLNRDVDPPGGYTEATRAETGKLMVLGLSTSKDPRAGVWKRQASMSADSSNSPFSPQRYVLPQSLSNVEANSFVEGGTRWTFSHDTMRYEAQDLRTGKRTASLGAADGHRFEVQPIMVGTAGVPFSYLLLPHAVYGMKTADTPRTWLIAKASPDETIASVPRLFDKRTYLITSKRVLAFPAWTDEASASPPLFSLPLPRQLSDLATVDVVHLLDGTLVSLTYGAGMLDGVDGGFQSVYFVDEKGSASEVARRPLSHDFPALFEHKDWWVSPVLYAVARLPKVLYNVGRIPDSDAHPSPLMLPRPAIAWIAAFAGMLGAAAGAAWWLRRSPLSPRLRACWMLSCLLLGMPALLSLIVLQARTRPLAAPRPMTEAPSPA